MNRRKALVLAMWGFVVFGIAGYFTPMFLSLGPNAKGEAALPIIEVGNIRSGETLLVEHPNFGVMYGDYRWSILFYRHQNGELSAWDVVSEHGNLIMPDWHWWRPSGQKCHNFSPYADANGHFLYQCHDKPEYPWYSKLQWDLNGKNVSGGIADMLATTGQLEDDRFKVGKSAH